MIAQGVTKIVMTSECRATFWNIFLILIGKQISDDKDDKSVMKEIEYCRQ